VASAFQPVRIAPGRRYLMAPGVTQLHAGGLWRCPRRCGGASSRDGFAGTNCGLVRGDG